MEERLILLKPIDIEKEENSEVLFSMKNSKNLLGEAKLLRNSQCVTSNILIMFRRR